MRRAAQLIAILIAGVVLGVSAVLVGQSDAPRAARAPATVSVEDLVSAKLWEGAYDSPSVAAVATSQWYTCGIVQCNPSNTRVERIIRTTGTPVPTGTATVTQLPSVSPTATIPTLSSTPSATPTNRPTATRTATPTVTRTPSATGTDDAPPQETLDPNEPTPEPGDKECAVKVTVSDGLIVRSGPARSNTRVGSVPYASYLKIDAFAAGSYDSKPELWARIYDGWVVIRYDNVWWIGGITGLTEMCLDVQGWPSELQPPADMVSNPAGIHVLGGFSNTALILSEIEHFNLLKVTDDASYLINTAKVLKPGIITIHRNIHLLDVGLRNCPTGYGAGGAAQARAVADSWFALVYRTLEARNLTGRYAAGWEEITNECGYPGAEWENAFWLRILELAKTKQMCIALYSDSFGTPEIDQFVARKPVLDKILSETCQSGKYHIISLHTYGRPDSGMWIFFRWLLFRDALRKIDPKYDWLQFAMTEQGITNNSGNNDGRGSADCGVAAKETVAAVNIYRNHPEILGFALYSFGGGTEWLNLEGCIDEIARALQ